MEPDYLTDKTGPADAEVERLEGLLSDARYKPPQRRVSRLVWAAAAVVIFLLPAVAIVGALTAKPRLDVIHADGATSKLAVGKWLETGAQTADVKLKDVGTVRVAPQSKLRLVSLKENEQRLELASGELHARVVAPPRLFVVETPAATAVDLGCEYTLKVTPEGDSVLDVLSGAVALEGHDHPVFVPAGYESTTKKGSGPSIPSRAEASQPFKAALSEIEASRGATVPQEAIATVLREATRLDAPTLFELLQRAPPNHQRAIAEQLSALIPPGPGIEQRVLQGDDAALAEWWARIYETYDVP